MNHLTFNHSCTNHSEAYVIVGNSRDLISTHESMKDAEKALNEISVGESKWAKVEILEPSQSTEIKDLQKTVRLNEDPGTDFEL